jgi:hypothetical protein
MRVLENRIARLEEAKGEPGSPGPAGQQKTRQQFKGADQSRQKSLNRVGASSV